MPKRKIFIAREITKKFESLYWVTAGELEDKIEEKRRIVVSYRQKRE
jgi:16S rRNA C1402 (ribose-2'-O) methylase RsmI